MKVHTNWNDDSFVFERLKSIRANAGKTEIMIEAEDSRGFDYTIIITVKNLVLITEEDMPRELKQAKYSISSGKSGYGPLVTGYTVEDDS